jgi:uncharacterized protein YdhG (YjbR/CyaY superfamily)
MSSADKTITPGGVDEYIATCPEHVRQKLEQVRAAIQQVAPDAIETVSYFGIPGYAYEGYDYNGMFAWFSYQNAKIRLHVRPPVLEDHIAELTKYKKTKSILSFDENSEPPLELIKVLVLASIAVMKTQ